MTPERWQRLKDIFAEAVEKPASHRDQFLESRCGEDVGMLEAVRDLLEAHARAADFPSVPSIARTGKDPGPQFQDGDLVAGRFHVVKFLARGGIGEVYKAHDGVLNQDVALKTIQRGFGSHAALDLLKVEVQSARRITHPNVCRIYDIAEHAEPPTTLLTMGLLEGQTLSRRLRKQGPFTRAEALPVITQIAAGLEAAHSAGVIHRDLKAGNIILTSAGPVITDFGMALSPHSRMEDQGMRGGTPGYMAPEQIAGEPATAATDIYALGVIIAVMLGVRAELSEPARVLADSKKLGPWKAVVTRCLAHKPADRYQSASEVAAALQGSSRRPLAIAAAAVTVAAATLLLYRAAGPPPPAGFVTRKVVDEQAREMLWGVSADERWIVATDWSDGQLVLRDRSGTPIRRLTRPRSFRTALWNAIFARDGRAIAFSRRWESGSELCAVDTGTGQERTLLQDDAIERADPAAWAPNGSALAVYARWKDGRSGLGLLELASGKVRQVSGSREANAADRVLFSPSGRDLIFDAPQSDSGSLRNVYAVGLDGSRQRGLISSPYDERLVDLFPNGRGLVFASDVSGTYGIWTASLGADLSVGRPQLAFAASGRISPLGITRRGTLYYKIDLNFSKVYTATLDLEQRKTISQPVEAGLGMFPSWSKTGELAFQSTAQSSRPELIFMDGGRAVRNVPVSLGGINRPRWRTADRLVVWGTGQGKEGYFEIDARTGQAALLVEASTVETSFEGAWSRGGEIWFNRYGASRRGLFRMDFRSRRRDGIFTPAASQELGQENLAVSPDGRMLAFQVRERPDLQKGMLMVIPTGGGEARPIMTVQHPRFFGFGAFEWLPDSRTLLAAVSDRTTGLSTLWVVPASGGEPASVDFPAVAIRQVRLSPDGKTIAYFSGQGEHSELRALENFLPAH